MHKPKIETERINRLKQKIEFVSRRPLVKKYFEWQSYNPQQKAICYREWDAYYSSPGMSNSTVKIPKPTSIDPYEIKHGWDVQVYETLKEGIDKLSGGGDIYDDAKEIFG